MEETKRKCEELSEVLKVETEDMTDQVKGRKEETAKEMEIVQDSIMTAADATLEIIQNGLQSAMNKFNVKTKKNENTEQTSSH